MYSPTGWSFSFIDLFLDGRLPPSLPPSLPDITGAPSRRLASRRSGGSTGKRFSGADGTSSDDVLDDPSDDAEEDAADLGPAGNDPDPGPGLNELRARWTSENQVNMPFFTRILGGDRTREHKNKEADSIGAFARKRAKVWCEFFGFPKQRVFTFNLYGERGSVELATEVCRRGEFWFSLWLRSDDLNFVYTQDDIDAYADNLEFLDFLAEVALDHPVFDEAMAIRREMHPLVGPIG